MPEQKTEEGLKRDVGVSGLTLSIVNATIGAGIFVLPAIVSIAMGAFGIYAYIFCSLMLAVILLCYAEIGSRITRSGGSYAYVENAFGELPGFIVNCLFVFGYCILSCAALLNLIADSLAILLPVFTNPNFRAIFFLITMIVIVRINIGKIKNSIRFIKLMTIIKLLPLFGIILFGFSKINTANLKWESLPTFATFSNTALVLFFAFAGFESSLSVSGEIKNTKRTVPLAILLGGSIVLIVYLLLQTVTQGILGNSIINYKEAPLAAVAQNIVGPVGITIILFTTAFSCFSNISSDVLATPRLLFAGAKDGLFPKFLSKVHPRFATPYIAVIFYGACIFIFSIAGGFKQLALLASCTILLVYLAVILATIKLRNKDQDQKEKTFRIPGGYLIPLFGIAAILWLLSSLNKNEIIATFVFIIIIILVYYFQKSIKK